MFYQSTSSGATINKMTKFSATKSQKRESTTQERSKKLNIVFRAFKAKDPGCIDLNPVGRFNVQGDVVVFSEEINGWLFGLNANSQEYFCSKIALVGFPRLIRRLPNTFIGSFLVNLVYSYLHPKSCLHSSKFLTLEIFVVIIVSFILKVGFFIKLIL